MDGLGIVSHIYSFWEWWKPPKIQVPRHQPRAHLVSRSLWSCAVRPAMSAFVGTGMLSQRFSLCVINLVYLDDRSNFSRLNQVQPNLKAKRHQLSNIKAHYCTRPFQFLKNTFAVIAYFLTISALQEALWHRWQSTWLFVLKAHVSEGRQAIIYKD